MCRRGMGRGKGARGTMGKNTERVPVLIVLFLLEYSAGGSVEERGLTRYKHGWVAGRIRRMGSFGGVICGLQYTYLL